MAVILSWDPAQYARFAHARSRPFDERLSRVGSAMPRLVLDLGCGDGARTLTLPSRWPSAHIVGVDSSPAMLAAARPADPSGRVEWVRGTGLRPVLDTLTDPSEQASFVTAYDERLRAAYPRRWAESLAPRRVFVVGRKAG